jgi:hypothetical protein
MLENTLSDHYQPATVVCGGARSRFARFQLCGSAGQHNSVNLASSLGSFAVASGSSSETPRGADPLVLHSARGQDKLRLGCAAIGWAP